MAIEGPEYYYIHCSKTASMSIRTVLMSDYGGSPTIDPWQREASHSKFTFASVRNPYERCLSLWWSLIQGGDSYGVVDAVGTDPVAVLDFTLGGGWGSGECPHRKQVGYSDLTRSCVDHIGNHRLDAVIRYESLNEDFSALPFVDCPTILPIVNRKSSGRPDRWPLELPEFIEAVNRYCAKDFIVFDYELRTS